MLRGEINSAMITENMPESLLHIALLWPITKKIVFLHKNQLFNIKKIQPPQTLFFQVLLVALIQKIKQVKMMTTTNTSCCMQERVCN